MASKLMMTTFNMTQGRVMQKLLASISLLILYVVINVATLNAVQASEPAKASDRLTAPRDIGDKAGQVSRLLQSQPLMYAERAKEGISSGDVAFCEAFLDDFKVRDGVQYIKPVLAVEDANHPGLQHYHSCQESKQTPIGEIRKQILFSNLTNLGTRSFRLYMINSNNGAADVSDELIYGQNNEMATYASIDLKECIFRSRLDLRLVSNWPGKTFPVDNQNGLIQYKGRLYIFELLDLRLKIEDEPSYALALWGNLETQKSFRTRLCYFNKRGY